jgi:hypothetical protein
MRDKMNQANARNQLIFLDLNGKGTPLVFRAEMHMFESSSL